MKSADYLVGTVYEVSGSVPQSVKCLYDLQLLVLEFWMFSMYILSIFLKKYMIISVNKKKNQLNISVNIF